MPRSAQTRRKSKKSPAEEGRAKKSAIRKKRAPKKSMAKKASKTLAVDRLVPKRRRARGERAAQTMIELQTKNAKSGQRVENLTKFRRSMFTCFRNMVPSGQIGSDAAAIVYEDVNKYGSSLVSKALEFAFASGRKEKKITVDHLISALSTDKSLLAGITPHSTSEPVPV